MPKYYNNTGNLLARALQKWNKKMTDAFEKARFIDIKPSYGAIFILLFEKDGLPVSEIIKRTNLSKQVISGYLKELQNKNYIELGKTEADQRKNIIFLTVKGNKFKQVAIKIINTIDQELFKKLGKTDFKKLQQILIDYLSLK